MESRGLTVPFPTVAGCARSRSALHHRLARPCTQPEKNSGQRSVNFAFSHLKSWNRTGIRAEMRLTRRQLCQLRELVSGRWNLRGKGGSRRGCRGKGRRTDGALAAKPHSFRRIAACYNGAHERGAFGGYETSASPLPSLRLCANPLLHHPPHWNADVADIGAACGGDEERIAAVGDGLGVGREGVAFGREVFEAWLLR